jgi:predicted cupin superfamily sugar epimerase
MSKKLFVDAVEKLFAQNDVAEEVKEYFNNTLKAKRINKTEVERTKIVKNAIYKFLEQNPNVAYDRVEIGSTLYNEAEFPEEYLVNEKGTIAYNSITAYANQLVNEERIVKNSVKAGKSTKIVYSLL